MTSHLTSPWDAAFYYEAPKLITTYEQSQDYSITHQDGFEALVPPISSQHGTVLLCQLRHVGLPRQHPHVSRKSLPNISMVWHH